MPLCRTSSRRYLHASRSTSDILLRRIRLPNIEGPSFHASFPVVLLHHFSQHLKEFTIENKRVHPTVPSIVRHHPLHPLAPTNTQNPRTSPAAVAACDAVEPNWCGEHVHGCVRGAFAKPRCISGRHAGTSLCRGSRGVEAIPSRSSY